MWKTTLPFLLVIALISCDNLETKKVSSDAILEEELKTINMKEVDDYPSFSSCDSITDKAKNQQCFQEKFATNFHDFLNQKIMVFDESVRDTVWINISISPEGEPTIDSLKIPETIERNVPKMHQWLKQSLDSLPKIHPAIKRGIPVKTAFKMPVVIRVE